MFLSGNYTYDDIYLLDLSVRLDGSSEFGSDNRVAPFWAVGARRAAAIGFDAARARVPRSRI